MSSRFAAGGGNLYTWLIRYDSRLRYLAIARDDNKF